jgi:hypothetical protein
MTENFIQFLGYPGKMISGSKSGYMNRNPGNLVVFNSNVIVLDEEKGFLGIKKPVAVKAWFGDIDITQSREELKSLSADLGKTLLVLYETDARFENEDTPRIENFVYKVSPDGNETLGERLKNYYSEKTLLRDEQ